MVACVTRNEWKVMSGRPIFSRAMRNVRSMVVGGSSQSSSMVEWNSMVSGLRSLQNRLIWSSMSGASGFGMGTTLLLLLVLGSHNRYLPLSSGPRLTECRTWSCRFSRSMSLSVLLQCLFDRFGSVFPQCGLMVFPGVVIVSR